MATIEDYKKAVLAQYEEEKNGEFSEFLFEPTPAKLKKLSILLLDGLNVTDKKIFDLFFAQENVNLQHIEAFDNDKFKPLCNYIKGKSNLSRVQSIDFLAVFIKLNSRPFNKFRNVKTVSSEDSDDKFLDEKEKTIHEEGTLTIIDETRLSSNENIEKQTLLYFKPKQLRLGIIFVTIMIIALIALYSMYEEKGCMVWVKDHYEEVDCDVKNTQSFFALPVIALDKETCKYLKKVQVSDTTTFFNPDGTPRIWYGKSANKKYEYFSYPGVHPETKKTLKGITPYIIRKYIKSSVN